MARGEWVKRRSGIGLLIAGLAAAGCTGDTAAAPDDATDAAAAPDAQPSRACLTPDDPGLLVHLRFGQGCSQGPAWLGIVYHGQNTQNFTDRLPEGAWCGSLDVRADYSAQAVNGPAYVSFEGRPDPGYAGGTTVDVDVRRCTEATIEVQDVSPDAGVPDAATED
jgi:hypothetical protein